MDINHLKQKFIEEAQALLTNLDNVLIELEKSNDILYVNEVFRVIHTIKGACGMFGFEKIVEITHEVESLYDLVRSDKLNLSPELLELTFSSADHIRALLVDEGFTKQENILRHNLLIDNILIVKSSVGIVLEEKSTTISFNNEYEGVTTWNIIFYPNDELIRRCINMIYTFQDLFALGEYKIANHPFDNENEQSWNIFLVTDQPYDEIENALMFVLDFCKITKVADFDIFNESSLEKREAEIQILDSQPEIETIVNSTPSPFKTSNTAKDQLRGLNEIKENAPVNFAKKTTTHINVEASKLDTLMYLVSELVTTKSELLLSLHKKNELKALDAAEKIEKLSKLFSENALSIRLVSLQEMLNKFKRLIRDLSKQLDKNIDFVIVGDDTELDKNIIDVIDEPVMHLIRNCVDHGIESPEKRKEKNKPENGVVRFEAQKTGNYVYIIISDDGKGMDSEFIYNKAVEKGFVQPGAVLNEKEIFNLIFLPGFSTAESLSNVSGRGVGMDIVLKKIQEIRGEITVTSTHGIGTTFTIKLKQTISIIETLLVVAGNITYAIPVEDIESCLLEAHENIINRQSNLIVFNNELIPFFNLHCQSRASTLLLEENEKLIIVKKQNRRYAIVADAIIGEYQAVIKPLGKAFSNVSFLSGASLLGDGSIALLIDTDKLWYETAMNKVDI